MRLHRFEPYDGSEPFVFPIYDIQSRLGDALAGSDFVMTTGNAFDPHGHGIAREDPHTIGVSFEHIVPRNAQDLRPLIDETRCLRGKKGRLYARPYVWSNPPWPREETPWRAERWIEARCVQAGQDRTLRNYLYQPFDLVFEVANGPWHALRYDIWLFDGFIREDTGTDIESEWQPGGSGTFRRWDIGGFTGTMTASPYEYKHTGGSLQGQWQANVKGNAAVTDAVISLIPTRRPVSYVEIQGDRTHLIFEDQIAIGASLTIDCGQFSVTNAGNDAFHAFRLGPSHRDTGWLTLQPGENPIRVTYTVPDGDHVLFSVAWFDAWA